jgi:hypothetical protein
MFTETQVQESSPRLRTPAIEWEILWLPLYRILTAITCPLPDGQRLIIIRHNSDSYTDWNVVAQMIAPVAKILRQQILADLSDTLTRLTKPQLFENMM